jgi:hypothetical protein
MEISKNQPIFTLSVEEFIKILRDELEKSSQGKEIQEEEKDPDPYLYSIKEMQDFLHCSAPTAQAIKNRFYKIFVQTGRKFFVKKSDLINAIKSDKKKNN